MSNSNPIDGSINTNLAFERGGKPCETILSPYVQIGGPDMYGLIRPDWADAAYDRSFAFPPIQRFTLSTAVAPMDGEGPAYPGNSTWVLNLDTEQLYTMHDKRVAKQGGFNFTAPYTPASPAGLECYEQGASFGDDGVNATPVPVMGLPIEFRKVYFKGTKVSGSGLNGPGQTFNSGAECGSYYAYMATSLPIDQTCTSGSGESGSSFNFRNDNYGAVLGTQVAWEDFDIGCGGGGGSGGCSTSYDMVSGGLGFDSVDNGNGDGCPKGCVKFEGDCWIDNGNYDTPCGVGSGCDRTLFFKLGGCLATSGSGSTEIPQFNGELEQSGFNTIISFNLNPNIYQSISGSGSGFDPCKPSGCNGVLAFMSSGCLTGRSAGGSSGSGSRSQFETIITCDSGSNITTITQVANPDIYQKVTGFVMNETGLRTGCIPSGCEGVLEFVSSGCLQAKGFDGTPQFYIGVDCEGNTTTVTTKLNPDIYQTVSGLSKVCKPSGCNGVLAFMSSGCLTGEDQLRTIIECDSESNVTTVTQVANPNIYQTVSGLSKVCKPSGCNGVLAFMSSGCLTGEDQLRTIIECDSGSNITTITQVANPNIYQQVTGELGYCAPSGCKGVLNFVPSGCLTGINNLGNPGFRTEIQCDPESNVTSIIYKADPDMFQAISGFEEGEDAGSAEARGCKAGLRFEVTGKGLSLGISQNGDGATISFGLAPSSGSGGCTSAYNTINGVEVSGCSGVIELIPSGAITQSTVSSESGAKITIAAPVVEMEGSGCTVIAPLETTSGNKFTISSPCVNVLGSGCISVSPEETSSGISYRVGATKEEILTCLGYEAMSVTICEGETSASYNFLVETS